MNDESRIIGWFTDEEGCARGIEAAHKTGLRDVGYFAPVPSERLLEAAGMGPSPVRAWVLGGGITGVVGGFALTIGTSLTWSHVVGGKPIISIPPYIIIAFELMILCGALFAIVGFLVHGRVPQFESLQGYSSRFSADRFGVVVRCVEADAARAESILRAAGAEEVVREAANVADVRVGER